MPGELSPQHAHTQAWRAQERPPPYHVPANLCLGEGTLAAAAAIFGQTATWLHADIPAWKDREGQNPMDSLSTLLLPAFSAV